MKLNPHLRSFSLVELMIAMAIGLSAIAMATSFYLSSHRSLHASHQRMNLAFEMHRFTNEMIHVGSRANFFILYKSSAPNDIDEDFRQTLVNDSGNTLRPGGDFAVFVFFEFPKPTNEPRHRIRRIEGYYLTDQNNTGIGEVRKLTINLMTPSSESVEDILTENNYADGNWTSGSSEHGQVTVSAPFPMVRGLALPESEDGQPVSSPTPRLFYMTADRNVIISGQHFSGSRNTHTDDHRTHTNSFVFNITPRT